MVPVTTQYIVILPTISVR